MRPQRQWLLHPPAPEESLAKLGVKDKHIAQVLYNRGVRTASQAEEFLNPSSGELDCAFLLAGAHEAIGLLRWAARRGKRVVVYGDYDADGLAATALACELLESMGASVRAFIPNRIESGYGLHSKAIGELATDADVLLTVDCGITAVEEVQLARQRGLLVVVTDHHLPGAELPPAHAVVCPRLSQHQALRHLTGVGTIALLARGVAAIEARFGHLHSLPSEEAVAELAALGTIGDVAALVGENRRLVALGLRRMQQAPRPGIRALLQAAGISGQELDAHKVAFTLVPRLNAAGRIGSALPALELLLAKELEQALPLAKELSRLNARRQAEQERALHALRQTHLAEHPVPLVFWASESIRPGVAGLVASKVVEETGVSAVIVALVGGEARGSVRTPPGLDAMRLLAGCAQLLQRYGGHTQAAGFVCTAQDVSPLRECMLAWAAENWGATLPRHPGIEIDLVMAPPGPNEPIWQICRLLEPTGPGNPKAVFFADELLVQAKTPVGRTADHLLLRLSGPNGCHEAIAFGMGPHWQDIPPRLSIVYELDPAGTGGEARLVVLDMADASLGCKPEPLCEPSALKKEEPCIL